MSGIGARVLRTRWLVRAPIALYRVGLGWMLGSRICMLEHRGRRSGFRRFVCLEVVGRPDLRRLIVVSGFGDRSQWYQNLQVHPGCFVSNGRMSRAAAIARFLSTQESEAALSAYQQRYPRDWRILRSTIEKAVGHPVQNLSMVALDLV